MNPMPPDAIPQISLGTAALVIFAACAGFVLLRGITRMLVGTVVLGLAAAAGIYAWQIAPEISVDLTGKPRGWLTYGLPAVTFLVALFGIRKITHLIASPFASSAGDSRHRSATRLALRLLLALIPTSLIWLIGATLVHHNGSVAEVRAYSEHSGDTSSDSFSRKLKSSVQAALPASWLHALDPTADPSRVNLAKLIAARSGQPLEPIIDPRTGQPIPRAIIVDDPELQTLARDGDFGTLLRHPLLTKALEDPKIKSLLKDLNL